MPDFYGSRHGRRGGRTFFAFFFFYCTFCLRFCQAGETALPRPGNAPEDRVRAAFFTLCRRIKLFCGRRFLRACLRCGTAPFSAFFRPPDALPLSSPPSPPSPPLPPFPPFPSFPFPCLICHSGDRPHFPVRDSAPLRFPLKCCIIPLIRFYG